MDTAASLHTITEENARNRRLVALYAIMLLGLVFVFHDLLGLINGGGLFSVLSAIRAVSGHAPNIDMDDSGLLTLAVAAVCVMAAMAGIFMRIDLNKRGIQFAFIITIYGGGFVIDCIFDENVMTNYVVQRGYKLCSLYDHQVGHGKGSVSFNAYALNSSPCPRKRPAN